MIRSIVDLNESGYRSPTLRVRSPDLKPRGRWPTPSSCMPLDQDPHVAEDPVAQPDCHVFTPHSFYAETLVERVAPFGGKADHRYAHRHPGRTGTILAEDRRDRFTMPLLTGNDKAPLDSFDRVAWKRRKERGGSASSRARIDPAEAGDLAPKRNRPRTEKESGGRSFQSLAKPPHDGPITESSRSCRQAMSDRSRFAQTEAFTRRRRKSPKTPTPPIPTRAIDPGSGTLRAVTWRLRRPSLSVPGEEKLFSVIV